MFAIDIDTKIRGHQMVLGFLIKAAAPRRIKAAMAFVGYEHAGAFELRKLFESGRHT